MKLTNRLCRWLGMSAAWFLVSAACAADLPPVVEGDWVVRDFRFKSGEVLPQLRIHYRTLGRPDGEPVGRRLRSRLGHAIRDPGRA